MKKFIYAGTLAILMFSITGCSAPQSNNEESTLYQNNEFGFQIELPESAKGFTVNVDNNPIPPEAIRTIGFLLDGNGFLSIEIYTEDEWDNITNKLIYVDPSLIEDEEEVAKVLSDILPNHEYEEIFEKVNHKKREKVTLMQNASQDLIDKISSENSGEFEVTEDNSIILDFQKITDKEATANTLRKYIPGMSNKQPEIYLTDENKREVIDENVSPEIAKKIKEANIAGIGFEDDRMGTVVVDETPYIIDAKQTSGGTSDSYQLTENEFWKVRGSFQRLK